MNIKKPFSVCIVEDCYIQSTVLKKILETEGFNISGVYRSGEDLIENFETDQSDIYLMDIHLKGEMTGFDTANFIREKRSVPILFVTALNNDEVADKVAEVSHSSMHTKPIFKETFISSLNELVSANILQTA